MTRLHVAEAALVRADLPPAGEVRAACSNAAAMRLCACCTAELDTDAAPLHCTCGLADAARKGCALLHCGAGMPQCAWLCKDAPDRVRLLTAVARTLFRRNRPPSGTTLQHIIS